MLVQIKIKKTNRYLKWVNNNWYETSNQFPGTFIESDVPTICEQMNNHYVYDLIVEDINGNFIKEINSLKKTVRNTTILNNPVNLVDSMYKNLNCLF